MVKISRFDDAFLGILELEASPVEEGQLQQKDTKRREGKGGKNNPKTLKTTIVPRVFVSLDQRSENECFVKPACAVRIEDSRYEIA